MSDEHSVIVDRVPALEADIRGFADRRTEAVVNPTLSTVFDSLAEAYEFYNLYSWELGFGNRYGKSRQNVNGIKCMQEIVCRVSQRENSSSVRSNCVAMIRVHMTDDGGWLMGGKPPKTILTDQARAMKVAIQQTMLDTTHHWCKRHVLWKAKEHLWAHYTKRSDFRAALHKIFEVGHKWAKPYFSGKLCGKQTSTQRSESANHLLMGYIPPACPMNLFVKQYNKLQFDREAEEGFREKRTRLGGVVLRYNFPLEEHASQVYTGTMYEMFGQALYRAGRYEVEEVERGVRYNVQHVEA